MEERCRLFQESYGLMELPPELQEHGSTCEACREFVLRQKALESALNEWKAPDFSSNFTVSVMAGLVDEQGKKRSLKQLFKELFSFRLSIPLPLSAVSGFVLVASLCLNLYFLMTSPNPNGAGSGLTTSLPNIPTPRARQVTSDPVPRIPPQWTGTGAFLLIPMFDDNAVMPVFVQPLQERESEQDSGRI